MNEIWIENIKNILNGKIFEKVILILIEKFSVSINCLYSIMI